MSGKGWNPAFDDAPDYTIRERWCDDLDEIEELEAWMEGEMKYLRKLEQGEINGKEGTDDHGTV